MQGRILKGIGGFYYVSTAEMGEDVCYECRARGLFRREKKKPLVGDWVQFDVLDEEEKTGNITEILPRKNRLYRPETANIDQALVVFSMTNPRPTYNLLDRFLLAMAVQQIPTVLCFNKKDLVGDQEQKALQTIYDPTGTLIFFTSTYTRENIEPLQALLQGKTTVLAGPSGVGKSSLINLLQQHVQMETGSISRKLARGKHTTRHAELIPIGGGAYIVDTPGFSSFFLPDMEKEELKHYMPEFQPLQDLCKFPGCDHVHEPGCAVKEAVERGEIPRVRYQNYLEMYDLLKNRRKVYQKGR